MKKELILIGGGGHCKSCIDVIEKEKKFQIVGILDVELKIGDEVLGYKIIGSDENIYDFSKKYSNFFITVGHIKYVSLRKKLFDKLKELNLKLPVIISPKAVVSEHAVIGEGSIISHNSVINAEAKIGKNNIINTGAIIEHESEIGNHTQISTVAIVNGQCKIGSRCFIGSNVVINNNLEIADDVIIGSGSVVINSIKESGIYVGNPAKRIK
ncbi:MAG: acetyltransferase [Bacteroidota bacterium]|nr:acetyltransferase [Bacteroidota bacterium]